ncbi:hypothetical protein AURDEDRAFT_161563 [Auricularia subglabra TFB-10046 SS5]|nr:hypothetical protein AURDEDRAFT_161563 [Auricularia subglabra TFB-10046 SS5]
MPSVSVIVALLCATTARAAPALVASRGLPAKRGKRIGFIVGMVILGIVLTSVLCGCIILFCAACRPRHAEPHVPRLDEPETPRAAEEPKPVERRVTSEPEVVQGAALGATKPTEGHSRETTDERAASPDGPPPYSGGAGESSESSYQDTDVSTHRLSRVSADPPRLDIPLARADTYEGWYRPTL